MQACKLVDLLNLNTYKNMSLKSAETWPAKHATCKRLDILETVPILLRRMYLTEMGAKCISMHFACKTIHCFVSKKTGNAIDMRLFILSIF